MTMMTLTPSDQPVSGGYRVDVSPRALIAETIDVVAVLSGRGAERRLAELAHVDGLNPAGDYALTTLTSPPEGDPS